jgi:hypothetical protein
MHDAALVENDCAISLAYQASTRLVRPLGICWARMSRVVTLGTAFTHFLTVVARSGAPPVITRSQSTDSCLPSIDALGRC